MESKIRASEAKGQDPDFHQVDTQLKCCGNEQTCTRNQRKTILQPKSCQCGRFVQIHCMREGGTGDNNCLQNGQDLVGLNKTLSFYER